MLFLVLLPRTEVVTEAERLFGQTGVEVRFSHRCFDNLSRQVGFVSDLAGEMTRKPLSGVSMYS